MEELALVSVHVCAWTFGFFIMGPFIWSLGEKKAWRIATVLGLVWAVISLFVVVAGMC